MAGAEGFPDVVLADAIDALLRITTFRPTTQMLLSLLSFALFVIGNPSPDLQRKAQDLLNAIHRLAEVQTNMTVLVSTTSAFALLRSKGVPRQRSGSGSSEGVA
jgi:hypothetical protein